MASSITVGCLGCTFEEVTYTDGVTFNPGGDRCRECTCSVCDNAFT